MSSTKNAIVIAFGRRRYVLLLLRLLRAPTFSFPCHFVGRQERIVMPGFDGRFPHSFLRCLLPYCDQTTLVNRTGATTDADDANNAT
jgi:hypothetical protein